jgi:hypothetical protein
MGGNYGSFHGEGGRMNIADYIPKGHDKAVSRHYLATTLNLPDRKVRLMIAESEEPIFWHNGYFRHKNKQDIPYEEDYLRQEQARARALNKKVRGIKAAIYG